MWAKIYADYIPFTHPSHIACTLPIDATPPPAILATTTSHSHLISSTLFRFAVTHCFNADYSDRFHPRANNPTSYPCTLTPYPNPTCPPHHPIRYTWDHIIFHCPLTAAHHIPRVFTLYTILQSENLSITLCRFLSTTNSTLLCPLHPHPRPDPWLDP